MSEKWDARMVALAEHIAAWSRDPSIGVGAVIVRPDRTIASLGFNGFPRGLADTDERLHDRDEKLALTIHAELNAILSSHVPVAGMTIYVSQPCCDRCAVHIVQAGIARVVARSPDPAFAERWRASLNRASAVFREAGVGEVWIASA